MLLASIKSLKTEVTWKRTVYVVIVVFVILTALGKLFPHHLYIYFLLLTLLLFFIGAFIIAAKQVLFIGDIDTNKIIGSLTLYILLGLIWAIIYLFILALDPQAFSGIDAGEWQEIFSRVAYYSFVTLTTLGYGDILPTNHISEFFVYMESIIGVFYMAIIVSSLISLHLSALQDSKKEK
jgi:voltage-gated potassium channel Kch